MEKQDLELLKKALPMYLNHGLKCRVGEPWQHIFGYNFVLNIDEPKMYNSILSGYSDIYLRPLSDLKEVIEIDGNKFTPINQFFREARTLIEKELRVTNGNLMVDYLSWEVLAMLLKWNFDVFGLIKKGLAIDINTINNYKHEE